MKLLLTLICILSAALLTAQEIDVKFYGLDIEADNTSDQIQGEATVLARVVSTSMDAFELDLVQSLDVYEVKVNGSVASHTHSKDKLHITPAENTPMDSYLDIRIRYGGQTGDGMRCEVDEEWGARITYTSTEPFYARDWFPCKQDLRDKADSVHVSITTPYHLKALSQGLLTATTYFPNGKVRHEWKSNYPIHYFLVSIAVGE